jgi:hypothetical protein
VSPTAPSFPDPEIIMQTSKQPYELLIRWGQSGALAGAHVQHRYVTTDDGNVVGEFVGQAEPLTIQNADGFPLGDILNEAQAEALTAYGTVLAERDAALARVADLEAQLAALQPAA